MYLIIHYSEIGLKGDNRGYFEKKLAGNVKRALKGVKAVRRRYGKIITELTDTADPKLTRQALSKIPGVSSFAFAERSELNINSIKETVLTMLKGKSFATFGIITRRSNKNFPLNSGAVNIILGDLIRKKLKKKVNLTDPEVTIYVEISEKEAFIYTKKLSGIGGLPVGSSGKAVALFSGGIDSPVASFLAIKRGLKVIFVHVLNKTMTGDRQAGAKIEKIIKELSRIQGESKLYIVPFEYIQKAIIAHIPAQFRMIVYRRFMMRIAEEIANKEKAKGIITGDSVGQVASQTLDNLKCIYGNANLPVIPSLIGMNKEEIIDIARKIGTYELSIIPYPDCCSFLIAKHPETKGKIEKIEELENTIENKGEMIQESIAKAELKRI